MGLKVSLRMVRMVGMVRMVRIERMVRMVRMVRKVRMVRIVRIHPSRLRIVSTVNPTKPNATPNQTKPRI